MYEHSLQEGERAEELLLPQIAVSLIKGRVRRGGSVRERERESDGTEREGVELEMGGAAILRNANHCISSTVKNHRDADK